MFFLLRKLKETMSGKESKIYVIILLTPGKFLSKENFNTTCNETYIQKSNNQVK